MQLSELITEVYNLTLRPDLIAQTSSAVRAATLLTHHSDFYAKDLLETGIQFDTAAYTQTIDTDIVPRYRKIKYFRKYDNSTTPGTPGDFLTIITPAELLDEYGAQQENIAYEGGQNLQLSSTTELEHMLMGVYQSPDVSSLNYNSWVADNFSWLIVYAAARQIVSSLGNLEMARDLLALRNEQFTLFQSSALALVGE